LLSSRLDAISRLATDLSVAVPVVKNYTTQAAVISDLTKTSSPELLSPEKLREACVQLEVG